MRTQILGGGKMGEALVHGLLASDFAKPGDVMVVEKVEVRRKELGDLFPGVHVSATPVECDVLVIAVKPDDVEAACRAASAAGVQRALSIAAGVPLAKLEAWLGEGVPVVRAMPNTPAQIGAGASAIAVGDSCQVIDIEAAENILGAVGTVVRVPESLLDAVTGLSGSGPAYVFLVAEALIDAGVAAGLPRDTAVALANQTLLGAARLLVESGESPEALRAQVTSPGGTTAEGLRVLESRAVRSAFIEAVQAAARRSRELAGG